MAPRGPRSQAAQPGREPRGTSSGTRASTRGGIQKKRGGSVRVDLDGDLDMDTSAKRAKRTTSTPADSSSSKSRPTTRAATNNTRGVSKMAQTVLKHLNNGNPSDLTARSKSTNGRSVRARGPNLADLSWLRVHGLRQSKAATNSDGGLGDLLSFLERKSSSFVSGRQRQVAIKKSHKTGEYVFIGASKEDAEELLKVNTFQFAGTPLEIIESQDGPEASIKPTESKETQELRAKLQSILSQRYVGGNKLLKLDALAADAELVTLGMFETRERALKTFKGLMAICDGLFKTAQEKREAIESISLANNNIDDVTQVEVVATTFPQLKNLDVSGNQISSMQGLERWKGKFRDMESIYTTGNPIESTDPNFHTMLLQWFPKLQVINGVQLRTAEQIAEQNTTKPIPQHGPDFRDVNGIGEGFLLEFFTSYDSDRQGLISRLYDDASQFSLAVDACSVRDPNAPPPLPWAAYIKFSRNLIRINHQGARAQRLCKGATAIYELWKSLPVTRHPNIKEDLTKYIMDCHPLPGLIDPVGQNRMGVDGLIIAVHGEFEEYDQKSGTTGKRSFSRTVVLGPGQPGKGPIRVVSDMLSLRAYSSLPNVFAAVATQPTNETQHQAMVVELSKQTGMVAQYSEMCLTQVGWDFDKALVIFNEKKAQLPPEAFATAA